MTRADLLATLRATPDRVAQITRGLPPAALGRRPKEGEWSCAEVLHHLLVGERDVILPRLERMKSEAAPVFASSAPSRTGFAAQPAPGDLPAQLADFRRVRAETLAFLQALGEADWQRTGSSPTRGTISIEGYARYLAEHDLEHLAQLEATRAVVAGAR